MTGEAFRAIQSRLAEFQESGNSGPLLDAIALDEIADLRQSIGWPVFGTLPDITDVRRELNSIVLAGTFLWMRAQRLPEADQLDARLEAAELLAAANAAVPGSVPRPLTRMLAALTGGARDLDHAALHDQGIEELTAAVRGANLSALDRAIWLLMSAVRAAAGDPFEAYYRSDLGTAWLDRFQVTGRIRDLDNAVTAHEHALVTAVAVPEDQAGRLSNYSAALLARFGQGEDARDLSRALAAAREAARLSDAIPARGAGEPTRAQRLARLASLGRLSAALMVSFARGGDRAELDEAVQASRQAAGLAPAGDPAHARHQALLAQALLERFVHSCDEADLTEARAAAQAAADADPGRPAPRAPSVAAWPGLI